MPDLFISPSSTANSLIGTPLSSNLSDSALDVSLDYLVGRTDTNVDDITLKRVTEIQNLPEEDKKAAFKLLDAFLRDFKTKSAYI